MLRESDFQLLALHFNAAVFKNRNLRQVCQASKNKLLAFQKRSARIVHKSIWNLPSWLVNGVGITETQGNSLQDEIAIADDREARVSWASFIAIITGTPVRTLRAAGTTADFSLIRFQALSVAQTG